MNAWRAAVWRELRFIRGSRVVLWALLAMPLASLVLMAAMLSRGALQSLPVAVVDEAGTPASRAVLQALASQPELRIAHAYASRAEADASLRDGHVWAYVAISPRFGELAPRSEVPTVLIRYNAAYLSVGSVLERVLLRAVQGASREVLQSAARAHGLQAWSQPQVQTSVLFNPQASFEWFLQALVQPAVLHLFAACLGVYALLRELQGASLAAWRQQTGGGVASLAGKAAPYLFVMALWGAAWLIWLVGLRGWRMPGSLWLVWLAQLVLFAASIGISFLLVALTRKPGLSFSATALYAGSALAYSGGSLPRQGAPAVVRGWSEALPFTHYLRLQMDQFLGTPWRHDLPALLWLCALTVGATVLAAWFSRREPAA